MDFRRMTRLAVAGLAALTLTANGAQALVIDDFTQGPLTLTADTEMGLYYGDHQTDLDPTHVIGGERYSQITLHDEPDEGASMTVSGAAPGTFHFAASDVRGYFDLVYGVPGSFSPPTGLTPLDEVDLTQHGDRLVVRDLFVQQPDPENWIGSIYIEIRTRDEDGGTSRSSQSVFSHSSQNLDPTQGPTDVYLPFDQFNVDVTRTIGIHFGARRMTSGTEVSFSGIHVIPEPASLALLGLGGMVLLTRRRRIEITA